MDTLICILETYFILNITEWMSQAEIVMNILRVIFIQNQKMFYNLEYSNAE